MIPFFKDIKSDLPASIVVTFVAIPLCLGIALASGAPLFAGIIAGVVGGIVVGAASGSALGVSGPAAGLATIVVGALATLGGSWQTFLLAVMLAGVLQLAAGFLRLGIIAYYFPSSVIKGMLVGIGLIIILKQIPHAIGYDTSASAGDFFSQPEGEHLFDSLRNSANHLTAGAILAAGLALFILILWEQVLAKKHKLFGMLNGPLVAVLSGIALNYGYQHQFLPFDLGEKQVVQLPVALSVGDFFKQFTFPDFSQIMNPDVYVIAFVIAIVASIESLLSVEAADKMDPRKRITPTSRELKAQGLGNLVSGLIGGLPVTQVIVRSSANVSFGGKTKLSTILHGCFILISVIALPSLLNMIPLATLAAILLMVGYKLAKPVVFKHMYKQNWEQFVPFVATIAGMLATDLLKGVGIGLGCAVFFILKNNYQNPFSHIKDEEGAQHEHRVVLAQEVTFLNKAQLQTLLNDIPANSKVVIDASNTKSIHYDVQEIIQNFQTHAKTIGIDLKIQGIELALQPTMGH